MKLKKCISVALSAAAFMFSSYFSPSSFANPAESADTVVYGTIYTSNSSQDVAEALAVKDGKYIYVGDKDGAADYIDKDTKVIDHKNGMVMAGATEAHGHYIMQSIEKMLLPTHAISFTELKNDLKNYIAKNPDKMIYAGAGWCRENDLIANADIDYAKELDKICADKPILLMDNDHHQAVANTKAMSIIFPLRNIKMIDIDKGREDSTSIPGGIILRLPDGRANGYLRDQIMTYAMTVLMDDVVSDEEFKVAAQDMHNTLYRQGYTYYNDGVTNGFGYKVFKNLLKTDNEGALKVIIQPNFTLFVFEIENEAGTKKAVANIEKLHNMVSEHIMPAGIKLFVDGVTESQTGLNDVPYAESNSYGNEVLKEEQIYRITKAANEKGIAIHSHSYGTVAVHNTINAFIKAQQEVNNGVKNTMAHVRNVFDEDYKRMADNNIAVAENINWRLPMTPKVKAFYTDNKKVPEKYQDDSYPIKSFIDNGVLVASSTDAPAANDMPTDIFGIMEIAVAPKALSWTVSMPAFQKEIIINQLELTPEKIKDEIITNGHQCVSVKQALDIMTINGAKFMGIDEERGSIEEGKYADFLLIDNNVLECPADEIHNTKVETVYFEGEQVYSAK